MVLENKKKKCYPLQKKQIKTTKYLSSPIEKNLNCLKKPC